MPQQSQDGRAQPQHAPLSGQAGPKRAVLFSATLAGPRVKPRRATISDEPVEMFEFDPCKVTRHDVDLSCWEPRGEGEAWTPVAPVSVLSVDTFPVESAQGLLVLRIILYTMLICLTCCVPTFFFCYYRYRMIHNLYKKGGKLVLLVK